MLPGRTLVIVPEWAEAHCVVPDGARRGEMFRFYDWQLLYFAHFYAVKPDAQWIPNNPIKAPAFVYRRGLMVGPQKLGKNPAIAVQTCVESVGPALFGGWAGKDDGWACSDHGCPCGWEYAYAAGEPMGMQWETPLIQITAYSLDATQNTYDALRPMIELGPLSDVIPRTGEDEILLPGQGKIQTVTSADLSRLGQRVTFCPQDEVGLWTVENKMRRVADAQWRNLAGMGGRASLTTNAWDPSKNSVAQVDFESEATDIYRQYVEPPSNLSYANKRERHKIHQIVYPPEVRRENGGHLDLDAIEAEAADIAARDLPQASRFFGNKRETGAGIAFDVEKYRKLAAPGWSVPPGADIVVGFDGALFNDSTALVATDVGAGYQWLAGLWERPDDVKRWAVPQEEVDAAVAELFDTYSVWRFYGDPAKWESWMARWASRYGSEVVVNWWTYRALPTARACRGFHSAIESGDLRHSGDERLVRHIGNAYRIDIGAKDEDNVALWRIGKENKNSRDKMDGAIASVLSWEARTHALAEGVGSVVWTAA